MVRNIQERRKLSDLYKTGTEIRFGPDGPRIGRLKPPYFEPDDPPSEDEVVMFVRPASPLQRNQAMSEAQAARARALLRTKRDRDSEEHLTSMAFIADMSLATVVDYVLMTTQEDRKNEAIRDVLADDEWKEMTAFQDAMRQFEEEQTPEDDPEYAALLEKDKEYGKQVNDRFMEITDAERTSLEQLSREELEKRALDKRGELVGSQRFMETFELFMTYYAIRDADAHDVLFFDSVRELQEQDDEIMGTIKDALRLFIDDPAQAKNWQGAVSGSESSAPPSEPEISELSTPEPVSA